MWVAGWAWVQTFWGGLVSRDGEGQHSHCGCCNCGPAIDGGQARAVVDERADTESRNAVADLIKRDYAASDARRHRGQGILSERCPAQATH